MRTIVVLPAPFGPSNARTEPASALRLTLSRTRWLPNDLQPSPAMIAGVPLRPVISCHPLDEDLAPRGARRPLAASPVAPSTPVPAAGVAPSRMRRTPPTPTRSLAARAGR